MTIIVFSVSVGAYDHPRTRAFAEAGVSDYLLFTDNSAHALPPWKPREMPLRSDLTFRRWSRTVKIRPHLFLPPHDVSIYMDYSFEVYRPCVEFLIGALGDADLAVHAHKFRDCAYEEAKRCRELGFERPEVLISQKLSMMERGFPPKYGLGENGVIVRRNTSETTAFNEAWWEEYMAGGQRDQVSMPVARWISPVKLNYIPGTVRDSGYYRPTIHAKDRRVVIPKRHK
jgi:hypothetical protein